MALKFFKSGKSKSKYSMSINGSKIAFPPNLFIFCKIFFCLFLFLVIKIFFPNNFLFSNHLIFSRNLTTSPITIITGDLTLFFRTISQIFFKFPTNVFCLEVVPSFITATGVSSFFPYFIRL